MDIRTTGDDEAFKSLLIGLIKRIPLDQDGWDNFSKALIDKFNASYVHIQAFDFEHQVVSYSNGIGPLAVETYALGELNYLRYPVADDPRWAQFLAPERRGWYQCHNYISEDFVEQSDLYQKILLPVNLRYVASHELLRDEQLCVFWSISTASNRQPLNQSELDFLNELLPLLRTMVMSQRHLYTFSLDNIVGYNLIDQLNQPILLLNLSGQVVYLNKSMHNFLQYIESIKIENQQLKFNQADQIYFDKLLYQIEYAFRYDQAELVQYHAKQMTLSDPLKLNTSFNINLLVSKKEMSFFGIRPLMMLVFHTSSHLNILATLEIAKNYQLSHVELKQRFNLSKRETEVCQLFVNGMKLEHIAEHCGLTIGSLRIYIKRIFAKTNTHSQTALMRLLLEIAIKPEYLK